MSTPTIFWSFDVASQSLESSFYRYLLTKGTWTSFSVWCIRAFNVVCSFYLYSPVCWWWFARYHLDLHDIL